MDTTPAIAVFMPQKQPLTPVSPLLPTSLPHVCEPIPPLPMTPPDADEILDAASNAAALRTALHVIATERDGLTYIEKLYQSNPVAQEGFMNAVNAVAKSKRNGGKLIVSGVGKSGKIGHKLVATMNSFGVTSIFMDYGDSLHGDLGMIERNDTLLLITFSGRTTELSALLTHIPLHHPIIILTSHTHPSTCPLFASRPPSSCILLPAPIPTSETTSFGLPAPTTSTTTALALADALALAVARRLHPSPAAIFHAYHPGGAIGAQAAAGKPKPLTMADVAVMVDDVPIVTPHHPGDPNAEMITTTTDILFAALDSTSGWVRPTPSSIISPLQIRKLRSQLDVELDLLDKGVVVEKPDWISVPAACEVEEARAWIGNMRACERGRTFLRRGTVLGIVDGEGFVSGVVEIERVVDLGG